MAKTSGMARRIGLIAVAAVLSVIGWSGSIPAATVESPGWSVHIREAMKDNLSEQRSCGEDTGLAYWLEFLRNDAVLASEMFCSVYQPDARVVVDTRGNPFLILERFEGPAGGDTFGYLTVSLWNGEWLYPAQRVITRQPIEPGVTYERSYDIELPKEGGLLLRIVSSKPPNFKRDDGKPWPRAVPGRMNVFVTYD